MNKKRFLIAGIVTFLVFSLTDFIIHNLLLGDAYMAIKEVWRPNMMNIMWIMHITGLVLSFLFVYIFIKGREDKGICEGVRFGAIIGLLIMGIGSVNQYVIYPIPCALATQWFIYGMIQYMIVGAVLSKVYKTN